MSANHFKLLSFGVYRPRFAHLQRKVNYGVILDAVRLSDGFSANIGDHAENLRKGFFAALARSDLRRH